MRTIFAVLGIAAISACTSSGEPSASVEVSDSAGVTIVDSHEPALNSCALFSKKVLVFLSSPVSLLTDFGSSGQPGPHIWFPESSFDKLAASPILYRTQVAVPWQICKLYNREQDKV